MKDFPLETLFFSNPKFEWPYKRKKCPTMQFYLNVRPEAISVFNVISQNGWLAVHCHAFVVILFNFQWFWVPRDCPQRHHHLQVTDLVYKTSLHRVSIDLYCDCRRNRLACLKNLEVLRCWMPLDSLVWTTGFFRCAELSPGLLSFHNSQLDPELELLAIQNSPLEPLTVENPPLETWLKLLKTVQYSRELASD